MYKVEKGEGVDQATQYPENGQDTGSTGERVLSTPELKRSPSLEVIKSFNNSKGTGQKDPVLVESTASQYFYGSPTEITLPKRAIISDKNDDWAANQFPLPTETTRANYSGNKQSTMVQKLIAGVAGVAAGIGTDLAWGFSEVRREAQFSDSFSLKEAQEAFIGGMVEGTLWSLVAATAMGVGVYTIASCLVNKKGRPGQSGIDNA